MGLPTFLAVFALCVVLLEPASAARGQKASEGATVACDSIAAVLTLTITNRCFYEITKGAKHSPGKEVIQQWLVAIKNCTGVELRLTPSIHAKLTNRAHVVHTKVKRFARSGGRQMNDYLDLEWTFEVPVVDVIQKLLDENEMLTQSLKQAETEVDKLERSHSELRTCLEDISNRKSQEKEGIIGSQRERKSAGDCSERHLRRVKKKRTASCVASLAWLEGEDYIPLKLTVQNRQTGAVETLVLNEEACMDIFGQEHVLEHEVNTINMILFVKDRFHISGQAYHELAKICKALPRHWKLKERIAELNRLWDIYPTPHGTVGVQQSLEQHLLIRVKQLQHVAPPSAEFPRTNKVRVKLSGDGTNIGKRLHVINFTFTVLDEGSAAYGYEGNHTLAILKESENYESLVKGLEDIRQEVERLKQIVVDGQVYDIVYFLGGDWKFLALCTGIDSAMSTYSCIWCKCPKFDRYDMAKEWSISDPKMGARTVEETLKLSKKRKKEYNVSHAPLFPTIPLTNVVIDNLHMFLRVSDVLINQLLVELKRQDAIEKVKRLTSFDAVKYKHLDGYQKFVAGCGVPGYQFYIGQDSKQMKIRSLTGPEQLKVFTNISIADLLPKFPRSKCTAIQGLWNDLLQLNKTFSKRPDQVTRDDISHFATDSKGWVRNFLDIYHESNVTPYIHAMANHVHEFMTMHGSILPFTQQGLEKYNDIMTKEFFRATCHRNEDALIQIIQKQNRLEHLRDSGTSTKKCFKIRCSNCNQAGHNISTCSNPCSKCNFAPCKAHLIVVDGHKVQNCIDN